MEKKQQMIAQQFKLRALNNPTSCSNEELIITSDGQSDQKQSSNHNQSTLSLVKKEINDFLELSTGANVHVN